MAKELIFVVEDDKDVARLVRHHLQAANFVTATFPNGASVMGAAEAMRPALFILDVMLPGDSGFTLCRDIRASSAMAETRVIFLTARTSEADRVLGLELGADDYISKPFSPRELVARVKAVLRRYESLLPSVPLYIGDMEIDFSAMTLKVCGKPNATSATEFRLLEHFIRNRGRVFTRDQILDAVWRDGGYVTTRSVDVYVRRIREKIERDPENPIYLKTVRGTGYRFDYCER